MLSCTSFARRSRGTSRDPLGHDSPRRERSLRRPITSTFSTASRPIRIRRGDCRLQAAGESPPPRVERDTTGSGNRPRTPVSWIRCWNHETSPRCTAAVTTRPVPGVADMSSDRSPASPRVRRATDPRRTPTRAGRLAWIGPAGGNVDRQVMRRPRSRRLEATVVHTEGRRLPRGPEGATRGVRRGTTMADGSSLQSPRER